MKNLLTIVVACLVSTPALSSDTPCGGASLFDCGAQSEEKVLNAYKSVFTREQNVLTVTSRNGKKKQYVGLTDREGPEGGPWYYVLGYWPSVQWYSILEAKDLGESLTPFLVDIEHGYRETKINGWPVLSPNQKKVVAYNLDITAHYSPNGVAVYSISKDGNLAREYMIDKNEWGVSHAEWASNDLILLDTESICGMQTCKDKKVLQYMNGEWVLK